MLEVNAFEDMHLEEMIPTITLTILGGEITPTLGGEDKEITIEIQTCHHPDQVCLLKIWLKL